MIPPPKPGTIIRYAYQWFADGEAGIEGAERPHPAVVLALAVRAQDGRADVLVLAITHAPPYSDDDALEIPAAVKAAAGLDADRQWVVIAESNVFAWPGPDLRVIPGRNPRTFVYGEMPPSFLRAIARAFRAKNRGGSTSAKEVQRP